MLLDAFLTKQYALFVENKVKLQVFPPPLFNRARALRHTSGFCSSFLLEEGFILCFSSLSLQKQTKTSASCTGFQCIQTRFDAVSNPQLNTMQSQFLKRESR